MVLSGLHSDLSLHFFGIWSSVAFPLAATAISFFVFLRTVWSLGKEKMVGMFKIVLRPESFEEGKRSGL